MLICFPPVGFQNIHTEILHLFIISYTELKRILRNDCQDLRFSYKQELRRKTNVFDWQRIWSTDPDEYIPQHQNESAFASKNVIESTICKQFLSIYSIGTYSFSLAKFSGGCNYTLNFMVVLKILVLRLAKLAKAHVT